MLKELLTENYIHFKDTVSSWNEALEIVAKPLIENKKIEQKYVDTIKQNTLTDGQYIVLRDGFALPHARPEDGVLELGMSLLILKEPVIFGAKEIYVIVMMCAPDNEKHLIALSQLVGYIDEDEDFDKFKHAKNKEDILSIILKEEK